jgi:hypothetical protein
MRISEAISPSTPLAVPFADGVVLNIEYRPTRVTLAQMEDMLSEAEEAEKAQAAEKAAREAAEAEGAEPKASKSELEIARKRVEMVRERLVKQVLEMVVSWDLTEDDGETVISLDEAGVRFVPLNAFAEIVKAVRRHQSAGDSGKD